MPFGVRMTAGASALLIAIGGGVAGVAALTRGSAEPRTVTAVGDAAAPGAATSAGPPAEQPPRNAVAARERTLAEADRTATRSPVRGALAAGGRALPAKAQPSPVVPDARAAGQRLITTRTEVETREIPYPTRVVSDPGLPSGSRRVQTPGVAGEVTLRYLVTLTDGRPTDRRLLDSTVTRPPQQEVVALGAPDGQRGCPLDFCVPLSRDSRCRHHGRDESADVVPARESGQVSVTGNDLAVLPGERAGWQGDGDGDGDGDGGGGGKCR